MFQRTSALGKAASFKVWCKSFRLLLLTEKKFYIDCKNTFNKTVMASSSLHLDSKKKNSYILTWSVFEYFRLAYWIDVYSFQWYKNS